LWLFVCWILMGILVPEDSRVSCSFQRATVVGLLFFSKKLLPRSSTCFFIDPSDQAQRFPRDWLSLASIPFLLVDNGFCVSGQINFWVGGFSAHQFLSFPKIFEKMTSELFFFSSSPGKQGFWNLNLGSFLNWGSPPTAFFFPQERSG